MSSGDGDGDEGGIVGAADLGGSVLTGINGNPLVVLARQLGLPLRKVRDVYPLYLPDGKAVVSEVDSRVEAAFSKLLDRVCKLRQVMLEEMKCVDVSLGTALEAFRKVFNVGDDPQEKMLLNWHLANLEYANASLLSNLTMAFWDQDDPYEMGGDHCFIPGGNERFIRALAEDLPIFYNRTVDSIRLQQLLFLFCLNSSKCPPSLEGQENLRAYRGTASGLSTGLLVGLNLDTSSPDTFRPPPAHIPFNVLFGRPQIPLRTLGNQASNKSDAAKQLKPAGIGENVVADNSDILTPVSHVGKSEGKTLADILLASPTKSDVEISKPTEAYELVPEEEDTCPICFEEYDTDNPRMVTNCDHDFHLSCLLEWMERSYACPVCDKVNNQPVFVSSRNALHICCLCHWLRQHGSCVHFLLGYTIRERECELEKRREDS